MHNHTHSPICISKHTQEMSLSIMSDQNPFKIFPWIQGVLGFCLDPTGTSREAAHCGGKPLGEGGSNSAPSTWNN